MMEVGRRCFDFEPSRAGLEDFSLAGGPAAPGLQPGTRGQNEEPPGHQLPGLARREVVFVDGHFSRRGRRD